MTERRILRFAAVLLSLVMAFGVAACGKKETRSEGISDLARLEVWSAASSVKIRREDTGYENKGAAALDFTCVKGETESMQLMLTPKDKILSYDLIPSGLSDGAGHTIEASAFEVYAEWYYDIRLRSNKSALYPAGAYPDALIPLDLSKKAGENTVEANFNQGIWVVVKVARDMPAGVYRGNFTLKADALSVDIPVTVTVYDAVLPEQATMGTIFLNRREHVAIGEHDGSEEIMVRYFDEMLDYRITLCDVPVYTDDPDDYAEFIDERFDNPNLTTYIIPYKTVSATSPRIGAYTTIDAEYFKSRVKALARRSTADRDLVKDAMLYIYSVTDEPELYEGSEEQVVEIHGDVQKMKSDIVTELKREDPDFFADKGDLENSINKIRMIITCSVQSTILKGHVDTYCPTLDRFHTESERRDIDNARQAGSEIWWYGCIGPRNPYCNYHIDDNILGARLMSWMQADYDVVGNLYYDISQYPLTSTYDNNPYVPCDPYYQPYRWDNSQAVNGDGFLVYPGSKYGYFGFLPSIRLMSIRDGMEEYELLKDIEKNYGELAEYYGRDINAKSLLSGMYSKVYTGTMPTTDAALFDATRLELLGYAAESDSPYKLLIEGIDVVGERASVSILLSSEYSLKINGTPLGGTPSGGGTRYTAELDLSRGDNYLRLEITNKSDPSDVNVVTRYLGGRTKVLCDFETAPSGITVSDNSKYEISGGGVNGNCLYAEIASVITDDEAINQNYYPTLAMSGAGWIFAPDFTALSTLEFDIRNVGSKDFTMTVNLTAGRQSRSIGTFIVSPGEKYTHIRLDITAVGWSKLADADGISLTFNNTGEPGAPDIHKLRLDNMYVTYKEGL